MRKLLQSGFKNWGGGSVSVKVEAHHDSESIASDQSRSGTFDLCGIGIWMPSVVKLRESAVVMELPTMIAGWIGVEQEPSQEEKDILLGATFEKASFFETIPEVKEEYLERNQCEYCALRE